MGKGDRFWRVEAKRQALRDAEAAGAIADSLEVRMAIMARVHSGEISLAEAQAELRRIQRNARSLGKTTRASAFRRG